MDDILRLLNSLDPQAAARIPDEEFDAWYAVATSFARGELDGGRNVMQKSTVRLLSQLCQAPHLDGICRKDGGITAVSEVVAVCKKVAAIFASKPKFTVLITEEPAFLTALAVPMLALILPLTLGLSPLWASEGVLRAEATCVMSDLIRLMKQIGSSGEAQRAAFFAHLPFEAMASIFCDSSSDTSLRHSLMTLLRECTAGYPKSATAIALTIVNKCTDDSALSLLWYLWDASNATITEAIVERARTERNLTPGLQVHRNAAGLSGPTYLDENVRSIPVYISKLPQVGTDATRLQLEKMDCLFEVSSSFQRQVIESLSEHVLVARSGENSFISVDEMARVLLHLDRFRVGPIGLYNFARTDHGELLERDDEWLALWKHIIEECARTRASPLNLVRQLLQVPTVASLSALSSVTSQLDPDVLLKVVLPCIEKLLAVMRPYVTGSQEDQEVVNLLRDSIRSSYIHNSAPQPPELGFAFFRAGAAAMAHGYADADRMPELMGRILKTHATTGSPAWISALVCDQVCCSPASLRAVVGVLLAATATETSTASYGVEEQVSLDTKPTEAFVGNLLLSLAQCHGKYVSLLWREIAETAPSLLQSHPSAVRALLQVTEQSLNGMIPQFGTISFDEELYSLKQLSRLLQCLCPCATVDNAGQLFQLLVNVQHLRESRAAAWGPVGRQDVQAFVADKHSTASALAQLIGVLPLSDQLQQCIGIPTAESLPLTAASVLMAVDINDPNINVALSRVVPHMFLLHQDAAVRLEALRTLNRRYAARNHTGLASARQVPRSSCPASMALLLLRSCFPDDKEVDAALLTVVTKDIIPCSIQAAFHKSPVIAPVHMDEQAKYQLFSMFEAPLHEHDLHAAAISRNAAPACTAAVIDLCQHFSDGSLAAVEPWTVSCGFALVSSVLASLISRLLAAAALTAESNPQGLPDPAVLLCMDAVASRGPQVLLRGYLSSAGGRQRGRILNAVSPAWLRITTDLTLPTVPVASIVGVIGMESVPSAPLGYQDFAAGVPSLESGPLAVVPPPRMLAKLNRFVQSLAANSRRDYEPIPIMDTVEVELPPIPASPTEVSPLFHSIVAPGPRILLEPDRASENVSTSMAQIPASSVIVRSRVPVAATTFVEIASQTFSAELLPHAPVSVLQSPRTSIADNSRPLPA